tara:strand:+ start:107 stop:466 length:360 start_codon:yes stop_codon:yes gene_type:complete
MHEQSLPQDSVTINLEEKVGLNNKQSVTFQIDTFMISLHPGISMVLYSLVCMYVNELKYCIGTQRRTKKVVHHQEVNEDKKLKSTIKKFGMQSLQDIDEVNMFKDDNTVIHLKRPQSKF